jgi:hypothetical protein
MEDVKQIQEAGSRIILIMHALGSALRLYETNNAAVVRQIDTLEGELKQFFTSDMDQIRVTLRPEEFFINDGLLKVDMAMYMRARDLALVLDKLDYGDIRFEKGCTREHIEAFVKDYAESLRANKSQMQPSYGSIFGKKAVGSSAAAFRFEPDRLAIWLYAGLLEVVEQLYTDYRSEKIPSLLPVRRSLQIIIDNMRENNGIYQMLSAIRDPASPRSLSNTRVALAIDAVAFGLFVGLGPQQLMNLALAGIMGGLETSKEPLSAISPLFLFSGLGELAISLVLLLHDARAARLGKPSDSLGKILMALEAYHQLLNENSEKPLPEIVYMMSNGDVPGVDAGVGKLFARYKGPFPIGSVVELDSGRGVVIGQPDNERGKSRPIVGLINSKGKLGSTVDLSKDRGAQIKKALSAVALGIDMAKI